MQGVPGAREIGSWEREELRSESRKGQVAGGVGGEGNRRGLGFVEGIEKV